MRSPRISRLVTVLTLLACTGDSTSPSDTSSALPPLEIAVQQSDGYAFGDGALQLLSADGKRRRLLVDIPGGADVPSDWSPDGARLLIAHGSGVPTTQWIVNADGTGLRQIQFPELGGGGARWMPDGEHIAFRRTTATRSAFVRARLDGTDVEWLFPNELEDASTVAWSPDGQQIVWANRSGGPLWIARFDGTGARQLTNGFGDYDPRWSPDGTRIAYDMTVNENKLFPHHIAVVNADGTGQRILSNGPVDSSPAWSPDGKWIAYARFGPTPSGGRCTVEKIPASGGTPIDLLPDRPSQICASIAWRPGVRSP
jgi:Tol biopolymer transport system component